MIENLKPQYSHSICSHFFGFDIFYCKGKKTENEN